MKIYVDGELPKSCDDCEFGYFYDCQYCTLRPDLMKKDEWCEKEKHCPLLSTQSLKQQVRKEVVDEIRERLKKANFEIMSPIDLYLYTDNFLYQVEKGENNVKD